MYEIIVLGVVSVIMGTIAAKATIEYFYTLKKHRRMRHPEKKPLRWFVMAIIDGLIAIFVLAEFNYGFCGIIYALSVTVSFWTISGRDRYFNFSALAASILNFCSSMIIAYTILAILPFFPWRINSIEFCSVAISISFAFSYVLVEYLKRSKFLPPEGVSMVLGRDGGKLLFVYLVVFSLVDVVSLIFLIPEIFVPELEYHYVVPIALAFAMNTFVIVTGSYFIVHYLYKITVRDKNMSNLNSEIRRERNYRTSLFSNVMYSICINLTNNTVEEGEVFLSQVAEGSENSISQIIMNYIKKSTHKDDADKLIPLYNVENLNNIFKKENTIKVRFRISRDQVVHIKDNLSPVYRESLSKMDMGEKWIWVEEQLTLTEDIDTKEQYLYIMLTDVNEKVFIENQIKYKMERDSLTGLYNRGTFVKQVDEFLVKYKQGTLYLFDLDNFKQVNDCKGHPTGDRLLVKMANILQDGFGEYAIIGRIGGDEFAVFSVKDTQISSIISSATYINDVLRAEYSGKENQGLTSTCSIGISIAPQHGDNFSSLYEKADGALYSAKENGKGHFVIYEDSASSFQRFF